MLQATPMWQAIFPSGDCFNGGSIPADVMNPRSKIETGKLCVFTLSALLLGPCLPVEAQQAGRVPLIGFVSGRSEPTPTAPDPTTAAFSQALRELGHVEGKNIRIEYRYAKGIQERIPRLVEELVQLKVDVLVSPVVQAISAAQRTTKTIPVVMMIAADPVAIGLIGSLAHPGGNVTGISRLTRDLTGKRLELLREVVPDLARVGVVWDPTSPGISFKTYEAPARALKIDLRSLEVRGPRPDLPGAFREAAKSHFDALIVVRTGLLMVSRREIVKLAVKNRLPSMYEVSEEVEAGGLMSYSAADTESYRRAATYVDKILKGAKPAELPVEQPTKFELVINLKTAKQIGLTIPPHVLARADRVIR